MKKLMVSTIILLPLLILAILLVSGAILSLVTHIYVESVEFVDNETVILVMKDEQAPPVKKLEVNVLPLRANNRELVFASDDESVVTIDEGGVVTAKYYGETSVSVASKENVAAKSELRVIVTDNSVHFVDIIPADENFNFELYNGDDPVKLNARVLPSGANNQDINWSSSNPDVLSVTPLGEITCHGASSEPVVIKATSVDKPEVFDSIEVTCREHIKKISPKGGAKLFNTALREAQFPEIVPDPADATYTLSYSSSNESIATVSETGAITFKKEGYVKITATATDRDGSCTTEVEYNCTDGFFTDMQFGDSTYTFDYDEFKGEELDITFASTLPNTYREVLSAEFDNPGILSFDRYTQKFTLLDDVAETVELGDIEVTLKVRLYDLEAHEVKEGNAKCTVTITRKTQSVSFYYNNNAVESIGLSTLHSFNINEIDLASDDTKGSLGVLPYPANHTDKLTYSLEDEAGIANITDGDELIFNVDEGGKVTFKVGVDGATLGSIDVTYTKPVPETPTIEIAPPEEGAPAQEIEIVFNKTVVGSVVSMTVPEGTEPVYDILEGGESAEGADDAIVTVDPETNEIKPIMGRGGFALVAIKFVPIPQAGVARAAADPDFGAYNAVVKIYIDLPIEVGNISFTKTNGEPISEGYTISKDALDFNVVLAAYGDGDGVTKDYMIGKTMTINGEDATMVEEESVDGKLVYSAHLDFAKDDETLSVSIDYDAEAQEYYDALGKDKQPDNYPNVTASTRTVHTTRGKLLAGATLEVTADEKAVGEDNKSFSFEDLGESLTFNVKITSLSPEDFELPSDPQDFAKHIALSGVDGNFDVSLERIDSDEFSVMLTAKKSGTIDGATLKVDGKVFETKLSFTVASLADALKVEFGEKTLDGATTYKTFLKDLTFAATISRLDGNDDITAIDVLYKFDEEAEWHNLTTDGTYRRASIQISELTVGAHTLHVKTEGGKATLDVKLTKLALSTLAFGDVTVEYNAGKELVELDPMAFGKTYEVTFPKSMQGAFNFCIDVPKLSLGDGEAQLGGFDRSEIEQYFAIDLPKDVDENYEWNATYTLPVVQSGESAGVLKIAVGLGKQFFAGDDITLHCGESSLTLRANRINVSSVEFVGYNTKVADDVYKGYQQVRVFAKHSDYGDSKGIVDFISMPVKALQDITDESNFADPSTLIWELVAVNSEKNTKRRIVRQTGATVTYYSYSEAGEQNGEEVYTILPQDGTHSKLVKGTSESGALIAEKGKYVVEESQRIPFVDLFAQLNSANIYFGNFVGLSESDIQSDLFGNFADEEDWRLSYDSYDLVGKDVEPSQGAFSFLSVSASDGAVGGVSSSFNFNVLQDPELVNVFNATGYYNHNKVVLHNNLYGDTELDADNAKKTEAKDNDLILDKTPARNSNDASYAGNKSIFGNGYQVNLNKLNDMIVGTGPTTSGGMMNHGGQENTGNATYFASLINVRMMGRNSNEKVNSAKFAILFNISSIYYTDLQNYSKMNPKGGKIIIKNSVLHNVAVQALQLWNEASNPVDTRGYWKAYLENVTIINATKGIAIEGSADKATSRYHTIYIKGYLDALNYNSFNGIKNLAMAGAIDDGMVLQILFGSMAFNKQSIDKYLEWFGSNHSVDLKTNQMSGAENFFVNPIILDVSMDEKTKIVNKVAKSQWGAKGTGWFYVGEDGSIVETKKAGEAIPNSANVWQWQESAVYVGGVGGIITVWDESQHKYLNIKDNSEKSNFATPLSGLDHVDPRFNTDEALTKYQSQTGSAGFGNVLITGYTFNTPNSVDGGQCTVTQNANGTYSYSGFKATATRDLGKLFTNERDIRLLCEYIDIDKDGTPILNTDHILWHMQRAYRNVNLIKGRTQNHSEALKDSLKNAKANYGWDGEWPDGTTLEQALAAEETAAAAQQTAQAAMELLETTLPAKREQI